jgi:hypothetical protein
MTHLTAALDAVVFLVEVALAACLLVIVMEELDAYLSRRRERTSPDDRARAGASLTRRATVALRAAWARCAAVVRAWAHLPALHILRPRNTRLGDPGVGRLPGLQAGAPGGLAGDEILRRLAGCRAEGLLVSELSVEHQDVARD